MTGGKRKTAALLGYYRDRSNEDVPVAAAAQECGLDAKVAATLAARMARNGILVRVRRGVYAYETGPPDPRTAKIVVEEMLGAMERAFGPSASADLRGRVGDPSGPDALSVVFKELSSVVGVRGGERILRGVLAELPAAEAGAVLRALGQA